MMNLPALRAGSLAKLDRIDHGCEDERCFAVRALDGKFGEWQFDASSRAGHRGVLAKLAINAPAVSNHSDFSFRLSTSRGKRLISRRSSLRTSGSLALLSFATACSRSSSTRRKLRSGVKMIEPSCSPLFSVPAIVR